MRFLFSALVLLHSILIFAGCGESPSAGESIDIETAIPLDTISAVDSIGILIGDSCYTLGAIQDFTMLPGSQPLIVDRVKGTVSLFDGNGVFVTNYGRLGEGPGEFQRPVSAASLSSGIVVIIDRYGKVNSYNSDGEYLNSWSFDGMAGFVLQCIPFDGSSLICYYFSMQRVDTGFNINYSLKRYDALTGEVVTEYFNWFGEPSTSTDFTPAYLVAASGGEGRMYLSRIDSDSWMVEVYGEEAAPLDTLALFSDRERITLPEMGMIPGITPMQYAIQDDGNFQQTAVNMPESHPFISALGVDGDGNIWCRRGGLPGNRWDVISPDGEQLREVFVTLPDSAYYIDMDVNPFGILAFDLLTEDFHKLYVMGE